MPSTSLGRPAHRRRWSRAVASLVALAGLISATPAARAADPSPSPFVLEIQAWLDAPLPPDAVPGSRLTVGAFLWDQVEATAASPSTTFMRLYPATGGAPPSESPARQDLPGHVVATLTVPDGGAGQLQIGIRGSSCGPDGCTPSEVVYEMAGPGPPTSAPLPSIADVRIEPLLPTLIAGEPTPVDLVLQPRFDWSAFVAPGELGLTLRVPREAPFATVRAPLADAVARRYQASVILPDPGTYLLEATTGDTATQADRFSASAASFTVIASAATSSPSGSGAPADDGGVPEVTIAALAVAVLVIVVAAAWIVGRRRRI